MERDRRPVWPILAGMTAGSVAAVVAALLSLPLRSPDDLLVNSASVTFVALLVGIAGGVTWRRLEGTRDARRRFARFVIAGFIGSVVVLVILDYTALDRFISFGVPIAAVIFAIVWLLTPIVSGMKLPTWAPLGAVGAAIFLGGGLAGFGDAQSGDLSLGDLPTVTTQSTTAPQDGTVVSGEPAGILEELDATAFTFSGGAATWSVPETFASSGLNTAAVGRSDELAGTVDLAGTSQFSIDLTTFISDQSRRDSRVRNLFAADPIATFVTSELRLPESYTAGEIFTTQVTGEMTIKGVTRTVTWDVEARITGTQLEVAGAIDIALTDFGVDPPSVAGFVTVEDSAHLEVLFAAG